MLFARGQRQHETALALGIHSLTAQATGHLANKLFLARKQPDIRSAELKADAKRLPLTHNNVRAHVTGCLDCTQCDRFRNHSNQQRAMFMRLGRNRRHIFDAAKNIRILHNNAARLAVDGIQQAYAIGCRRKLRRGGIQRVAGILRHRLGHADIMRMQSRREHRFAALRDAASHANGFPTCRRTIVHRCVGHIAAKQPRNLRLEFEEHLQRALRDFGLIRRIGRQEFAALDDMVNTGGDMMLIRARAQKERRVRRGHILPREI